MRIGKISTFIAQFTRPSVVNEPHVAASGLKAALLLSKLAPKSGSGSGSTCSKAFKAIALFGAGFLSSTPMAYASDGTENALDCPFYPWPNKGVPGSQHQASIRRGLQIFQDACSACHTISFVSYRGVAYTEAGSTSMAAEIEVVNDEMLGRQGKSDRFPLLYANEKAARLGNGGASAPDLSLITKGRLNGQSCAFSLLTSFHDPPLVGVKIGEGFHYNPYFRGGAVDLLNQKLNNRSC